jgi:energy-coupling factor transport system ATP-binding protein
MLRIASLTYHPAATPQPILSNISLELATNQVGLIVGQSGSGKSTLLEILSGFAQWQSGDVHWFSQVLTPDHLQQLSGLVFQFPERHFCGNTILEELRLGHLVLEGDRIAAVLDTVGLGHLDYNTPPHHLSGGQQRRLALAVQLLRQPSLLLLDEPTAGLDWSMRRQVIEVLAQLKKQWTVLVVSHEPEELLTVSDRAWRLTQGHLQELTAAPATFARGEVLP